MGAILQREQCDSRLAALEGAAYRDMHGLSKVVHRSMEVAAARKLRELRRVVSEQSARLAWRQPQWTRRCFICGESGACEHREEQLVSVWRGNA